MNQTHIKSWLWEFYAVGYDALSVSLPHRLIREQIIRAIPKDKSGVFFDLGCGTGTMLLALSKNDRKSRFVGIDISYVMVLISRIKQQFWHRNNIKILRKSADDLDFIGNSSVDVIYSVNTLFALANPVEVMNKIGNLLNHGGLIIVALPTDRFSSVGIVKEHIRLLRGMPSLKQLFNISASLLLIPLWIIVLVSNTLISLMEKNGIYTTYNKQRVLSLIQESGLNLIDYREILSGQMMIITARKNK